jgi:hypothetical protein
LELGEVAGGYVPCKDAVGPVVFVEVLEVVEEIVVE